MDLSHLNLRVRDAVACREFYEQHLGFRLAFEADGGFFLRNDRGFLLALIPVVDHRPLPDGFHIGFTLATPDEVIALHARFRSAGVPTGALDDERPAEDYVSFRCRDPDGTENEIFWDGVLPSAEA